MFKSLTPRVTQFHGDEKGNIAIMFGLTILAVTMMVGMAFDVGRAIASKEKVAVAVDAAALAAAKGIRLEGLSDADAIALAKKVFDENMRGTSGTWTTVNQVAVKIDRATSRATVEADTSVKTTFTAISGIAKMPSLVSASALFESKDIEVGVQLDLTGSMCSPCSKLDDLKSATKDLVDILIPATPTSQKVRVAFAPFSAGVNAGSYLLAVDGNRASANACVYERLTTTNANTDAEPLATDAFKVRADLGPGVQACPGTPIEPLTSDRNLLKRKVDRFDARSSTAGQLGAAWAWYLVSPKWKDIWPAASRPADYGDVGTDKVVILMTDGVYNTIGGVNYGDDSPQADTASNLSIETCRNMKEAGITVYTVGFDFDSIGSTSARNRAVNTLQACAGRKGVDTTDGYFYRADDGEALRAAFNNIATSIMRLRLTN